jgi:hypothetical protein
VTVYVAVVMLGLQALKLSRQAKLLESAPR